MKSRLKVYVTFAFFAMFSLMAEAENRLAGPGTDDSGQAQQAIQEAGAGVIEILSWIFGTVGVVTFAVVSFLLMQGKKEEFGDRVWNIAYGVVAFTLSGAFMGFLYNAFG